MSSIGARGRKLRLEAFGKAVRELRTRLGVSQEALGFRTGLDRTYVSGIERGVRNPTVSVVWRLADGLGTAPSELFRIAEEGSARTKRSGGGRRR